MASTKIVIGWTRWKIDFFETSLFEKKVQRHVI